MIEILATFLCLVCGVVQADPGGAPDGFDALMTRPDTVALSPFVAYGQLEGGERRYLFPAFGLILSRAQHRYPHMTEWRVREDEFGLTSVSNLTALRGYWFERPPRPLRTGDLMRGRFVYDPVSHDPSYRWATGATFERIPCPPWLRDADRAERALRAQTGRARVPLAFPDWFARG